MGEGRSKVAVIESRWEARKNVSFRAIFDLLALNYSGDQHWYEYEMVGISSALAEAIIRLTKRKRAEVLYIGAHGGSDGSIALHSGETVPAKKLAAFLAKAGPGLRGVYLASCLTMNSNLAERILVSCPKIQWVAGYRRSVDYIDSSALDLIFFNWWCDDREEEPPARKIIKVCDVLSRLVPGLVGQGEEEGLGFAVYTRVRGAGGVRDIMDV